MAQIQIPNFVAHNEMRQRGFDNQMLDISRMKTMGLQQQQMGMQNQAMQKEMQDRAELESLLLSTPPEMRERTGLEFLKQRDPERAAKLQATYVHRFSQKAQFDPENAAKELEQATGEKVELGERYVKMDVKTPTGETVSVYYDKIKGTWHQVTDAKGLAQFQSDLRIAEDKAKTKNDIKLEAAKAGLRGGKKIERTVDLGNEVEYIYTDGTTEKKPKGLTPGQAQPPKSEPGYYLPIQDAAGNITGAWNAKTGSYKTPPAAAGDAPRKNAVPTGEKKAVTDIESAETKIANIKSLYKPEYVGPIQGRFNLAKIKTPGVSIDKGLAKFVAANTTLKNEVIKFITGAQMSEPEAARIMQQVPDMSDKPEVWESKYEITLQNIQILKQKMAESGYVFGGGKKGGGTGTPNRRITDKSDDELKAILGIK